MSEASTNLGVCFFSDRLYYAINSPEEPGFLKRVGSFDFNFDINDAITERNETFFPHLISTFNNLFSEYNIQSVRALTHPAKECWTTLPKVVYDNGDEREDHLSILMKGVDRTDIEPTWHSLSKTSNKFLCIRRKSAMMGFNDLTKQVGTTDFISDFELASKWSQFTKPGGSFLMIGCHKNTLTISAFILNKFRAATYIRFDEHEDLPYLWLQNMAHSKWMSGFYENIFLFGHHSNTVQQALHGLWDGGSDIVHLNKLSTLKVDAEEKSYGFDLAAAFPAILLSLDF